MASNTIARARPDARTERYRKAEMALWQHYGLEPTERFIDLDSPPARLRVLEVGAGDPVLFIHGTVGPGSWAPFAKEFLGYRSLFLDRPGWGMSTPLDYGRGGYRSLIADVMKGVLDGLHLDTVAAVGHSIGDVWALGLAERHPSRVSRVVLLGGGPVVPEIEAPGFIKLLASPLGALLVRLPRNEKRERSMIRQSGHGVSLDAGLIPEQFIQFQVAQATETNAFRHERAMVRTLVGREGWKPGLAFSDSELGAISQPTLMVYGTADQTGSVDVWRRVMAALPNGELRVRDGAGHAVWLDDTRGVAGDVRRFLLSDEARGTDQPESPHDERAA